MRSWARFVRGVILPGFVLGLAATPSTIPAAGIHDLSDGWLLGPAAAAEFVGGRPPTHGGVWATVGQSNLFGMPELPVTALNLGLCLGTWPGQPTLEVGWQKLGVGIFWEDDRRVHLQLGGMPTIGVALRTLAVHTGGEVGIAARHDSHWQSAVTVQAQWHWGPVGWMQVQLWLPAAQGGDSQGGLVRRPLLRFQGWQGPLALAAAVDLDSGRSPTVGLEWNLGLGEAALGLRADPATGTLGPVLTWRRGPLLVRTSHLAHPYLGVTHRVQLGLGAWGAPRW